MPGDIINLDPSEVLKAIGAAFLLLGLIMGAGMIPAALLLRHFVLRRLSLVTILAAIIGFYLFAFIAASLIALLLPDVLPQVALLAGAVISALIVGVVGWLMARVLNKPEVDPNYEGLKFGDRREKRQQKQGIKARRAPGTVRQPPTITRGAAASTVPNRPTQPARLPAAPPAKPAANAPLRIQRDDDYSNIDWGEANSEPDETR